ncbi:MAG TPA: extracellular solute-binding protein [Gaiellales bacterium]|jgi:raffinose/stachyose/melibiose transport system substrate-binding protein|nr:extracellular solute-binding protein [Gaiellales bacterium]
MENRGRGRLHGVAVLAALAAVAAIAAVWTGTSAASSKAATNPFAHYGNITLNVWSADNQDPGPKPVIEGLAKTFEKKYPNVTIKLKFYDFNSFIKILKLSLNSANSPDVTEGNQGYGMDSLLVKAKLIKNLDPYAAKYGWNKYYPPGTAQQFRWTPDGKTYGKGNLWGVGQFGQSVGVFYNKTLLKKYGGDPASMPKTFADFSKLLGTLRAKAPSSMPIIELGNKDGYESLHDFGMVQGAYVTGQFMRNWIFHVPGSNYEAPANIKALTEFQRWFKAGYFGSDYNAVGENDASAAFAKGKGIFYLGGNWQAQVIQSGLKGNVGFMDMPPGPSGKYVSIGATSLPWHISARTKYADVGASFINWLISSKGSAQMMYAQNQIPAITGAPAAQGNPYLSSIATGWKQLVKSNGLTLYPDWASDTMLTTMGQEFQKMIAQRQSAPDTAKAIQADWAKFDQTIK